MKLGIISDSHGRLREMRRAVSLLKSAGAQGFVHCGDLGKLGVLDELAGSPCWFVWGNTDTPKPSWRKYVETLGFTWPTVPLEFTLNGKQMAIFHGHEFEFPRALDARAYDYLFHGHTHSRQDYHLGDMRVINPGSLHRVCVKTVALLDLKTDQLDFLEVR